MTRKSTLSFKKTIVWAVGMGLGSAVLAQQLNFMQIPPGAGAREPAPNVILSLDDSGSMGWDAGGCQTGDFLSGTYGNINDPTRPAGSAPCPARGANGNPSRIADLRAALRSTFGDGSAANKGIIRDGQIRLAWQALDDGNATFPNNLGRPLGQQNDQDNILPGAVNSLKPFTGDHRRAFESFVQSLRATSLQGTSLHRLMSNVDTYMSSPVGVNNPFANEPGVDANALACRRTFHVMMTDGAWNLQNLASTQAGNRDGRFDWSFPDGQPYTDSAQTNVYKDRWGGADGTLADWAMRHWATDYRTTLANELRPLWRVTDPDTKLPVNETVGGVSLQPFWNAKNNPMTWQGVTTYTIGFSRSAITWNGGPVWDGDHFGAGYASKVGNTTQWLDLFAAGQDLNRASDLWHAALNGRGRYYPAATANDLRAAFEDILKDILSQTAKPLVSIAANTSRLSRGGFAYIASYNSERWSGDLAAYRMNDKTGLPSTTPTWRASTLMDADTFSPSNRVVLTFDGTNGRGFKWANLTAAQRSLLRSGTTDSVTVGEARVNYLRGDRSLEQPNAGGYLRERASRLGNIVNSNLWYVGKPVRMESEYAGHSAFRSARSSRTPMVYVGANDGMLHGFNAQNGNELLAYVPMGAYMNLRDYTQPDYSHRYIVDGHPFAGDAKLDSGWATVLVGTMGAGGKGYFILDVTNPANFTDPGIGNSPVVMMDRTVTTDADIGHIFAPPTLDNQTSNLSQQIVKLNNDRWAVILGNGYNSTNENSVLLIQYLDGSKELKKIVAASGGGSNGLGAPATFDVNSDGKVDVVYAGDLKGNLWKFNLVDKSDANWGVSEWTDAGCASACEKPLMIAKTSTGNTRPITAAPMLFPHPKGGLQVIFGTGRDLVASDRSGSQPKDTIFSVWDLSTYKVVEQDGQAGKALTANEVRPITADNARTVLVEQTTSLPDGNTLEKTSKNPVEYSRTDPDAKRGWFFDLPVSGERVLIAPRLFDGQTLLINSVLPKSAVTGETCNLSSVKDRSFISFLNAISGAPPQTSVFGEALDPSGNASRIEYGSGEFITLVDSKNRKTTGINTDYFCTGDNCDGDTQPTNTAVCEGAACVACVGNACPPTQCVGEGCLCDGNTCNCLSDLCSCTGPNCVTRCGITGSVLSACKNGFFGARTDWRELR